MGPAKVTWVHYCYSAKCVGFEPFYKVGPATFQNKICHINMNYNINFLIEESSS